MVPLHSFAAISALFALLHHSTSLVYQFDHLVVTPFFPREQGEIITYKSKYGGGYFETVVTPLSGNVTLLEYEGRQKYSRGMNPDFIDSEIRIKQTDEINITVQCEGQCSYTLRFAEKRNYAMPMLHRLLEAVPQDDVIGRDTLFTGITTKYFQIIAPAGTEPLFLNASPYNGRISVNIRKCDYVTYLACMEYEKRGHESYLKSEQESHLFTARDERDKGNGNNRRNRGATSLTMEAEAEAALSFFKDVQTPRNDTLPCSYIIRVTSKKIFSHSPTIARFRLKYWFGDKDVIPV
jgi:hypothetical protein